MKRKFFHFIMLLGIGLSVYSSNMQAQAEELARTPIGVEIIKVPTAGQFPSSGTPNETSKPNKKVQIQFVTQPSKLPKTGEQGSLWGLLGWSLLGAACIVYIKKEKERKKNNGTI